MRNSEISGGQEGTQGASGERAQRQGTQDTTVVNLFSLTQSDGLVPTINPLGASDRGPFGIAEPPRIIGEAKKDREPEDKLTVARAMAKRVLNERLLDLQAVYGIDQPAADIHELGIERSRALIAIETLDYYDDPYDLRTIASRSLTQDDLRERSEFAELDEAGLRIQAEIMSREVGLRLAEMPRDVRGPDIDIYRRLRIKADEVLEDKPDRQVSDVFSDEELYRYAFTGLYINVGEFIVEQQRFIRDIDYMGLMIGLEARDPHLEVEDIEQAVAAYELVDLAMVVARARRMWGDDAYEALSPDIRSQLPTLPLRRDTSKSNL